VLVQGRCIVQILLHQYHVCTRQWWKNLLLRTWASMAFRLSKRWGSESPKYFTSRRGGKFANPREHR